MSDSGDRSDVDGGGARPSRRPHRPSPLPPASSSPHPGLLPHHSPGSLPRPITIALGVLGPVCLTLAYFTLPFGRLIEGEHLWAWFLLGGLPTLMAIAMLATTVRTIANRPGHPALGILLLSWASILTFSAIYWALAVGHGQFSGLRTRLDALYFTGVTMATVGYGDIHPTGQAARAIVLVQLLYTFAFLAGGVTALGTRLRGNLSRRMAR